MPRLHTPPTVALACALLASGGVAQDAPVDDARSARPVPLDPGAVEGSGGSPEASLFVTIGARTVWLPDAVLPDFDILDAYPVDERLAFAVASLAGEPVAWWVIDGDAVVDSEAGDEIGLARTLQAVDLDGDGRSELLASRRDPAFDRCAAHDLPVRPAVWDAALGVFRPAVVRLPVPAEPVAVEGWSSALPTLARPTFVSDASVGGGAGPAPAALSDGDPATRWTPAPDARGAFAVVRAPAGLPLRAVVVANGDAALRVRLHTPSSVSTATVEPGAVVRLAVPGDAPCATLEIDGVQQGRDATLAELGAVTDLDPTGIPDARALADISADLADAPERLLALGRATATLTALQAETLAIFASTDSAAQRALARVIGTWQPSLDTIAALLDDDHTDGEALSSLLAAALPGSRTGVEALLRAAARRPEVAAAAATHLARTPGGGDDALALLPRLDAAAREPALALLREPGVLDARSLATSLSGAGADTSLATDLLRLAYRVASSGDRDAALLTDPAIALTPHDDATVARLALRVLAELCAESATGVLLDIARHDPAQHMRAEAFASLLALAGCREDAALEAGWAVEGLSDANATVRLAVLEVVRPALLADPALRAAVEAAMLDPWPEVANAAARLFAP